MLLIKIVSPHIYHCQDSSKARVRVLIWVIELRPCKIDCIKISKASVVDNIGVQNSKRVRVKKEESIKKCLPYNTDFGLNQF